MDLFMRINIAFRNLNFSEEGVPRMNIKIIFFLGF